MRTKRKPGDRFQEMVLVEHLGGYQWRVRCDCGNVRDIRISELVSGQRHCADWTRHEHPASVATPGYRGMHQRVRRARGSASAYPCVDCNMPAQQWSYDHLDPGERRQWVGHMEAPYSLNIEHYVARCIPCHKRFDLDRETERAA